MVKGKERENSQKHLEDERESSRWIRARSLDLARREAGAEQRDRGIEGRARDKDRVSVLT